MRHASFFFSYSSRSADKSSTAFFSCRLSSSTSSPSSAAAAAAAGGAGDGANAPPRASEVVGQNGRRATYRRRRADGSYVGLALRDGLRYLGAAGRLYFQEVAVSRLLEEESIEHKQMYITRTAHDLKTPVTTFRLALDQLAATPITDEQRELLEMALSGDVSSVPVGRRPEVDLDAVMGEVSSGMRALMAAGSSGDAATDQ